MGATADTVLLRELADRDEIRELTARYNRAADGTDPEAVLAVFTPAGVMELNGAPAGDSRFEGPELAGLAAPAEGQRVHLTTDAIVTVDGDHATQDCSLLLLTRSRRQGIVAIFSGRYTDRLVRTADGWRFASRIARVDFEGEGRMSLAAVAEERKA